MLQISNLSSCQSLPSLARQFVGTDKRNFVLCRLNVIKMFGNVSNAMDTFSTKSEFKFNERSILKHK